MKAAPRRTLILGGTYATFHTYWRTCNREESGDIVGFVYCFDGICPFQRFVGLDSKALDIWQLSELESVIMNKHIEVCSMQLTGLTMNQVQSIINRVMAVGTCSIEFVPPRSISIRCFKPMIMISSLARQVGKTQLGRYFCSVLASENRRVCVILAISDIMPGSTSNLMNVDEGPHYEIREGDTLPNEIAPRDQWIITQYLESRASIVYASSDIRRSVIMAEQQADIIIYDTAGCEYPHIKDQNRFCVIDVASLLNDRNAAVWPGLVNLMASENVVCVTKSEPCIKEPENMTRDMEMIKNTLLRQNKKLFFAESTMQIQNEGGQTVDLPADEKVISVSDRPTSQISLRPELMSSPFFSDIIDDDCDGETIQLDMPIRPETPEDHMKCQDEMKRVVDRANESDINVILVSTPRKLKFQGLMPGTKVYHTYRDIQDRDGTLYHWLARFFPRYADPLLRKHFESQVDIIQSMMMASSNELFVTNNSSANRGAFCKLFLEGHLPPGFRVTKGEIVDSSLNHTGELDVVVVTDLCPRMTIDVTDSVIAPILADSVLAVVDIKQTLSIETLKRSVNQLRPVKSLMTTHATLRMPDGRVGADPLDGKILTGIFSFYPSDRIEQQIPSVLEEYPGVVDFIVVLDSFAYVSLDVLRVCEMPARNTDIVSNGYAKYTGRGMGLALMFGIMNFMAANRRFSGSSCIRYVHGMWGGLADRERKIEAISTCMEKLGRMMAEDRKEDFEKGCSALTEICQNIPL